MAGARPTLAVTGPEVFAHHRCMVKSRARSRSLPRGRAVDVVVAAAPARRKHFLALLAVIQKAKRTEASDLTSPIRECLRVALEKFPR